MTSDNHESQNRQHPGNPKLPSCFRQQRARKQSSLGGYFHDRTSLFPTSNSGKAQIRMIPFSDSEASTSPPRPWSHTNQRESLFLESKPRYTSSKEPKRHMLSNEVMTQSCRSLAESALQSIHFSFHLKASVMTVQSLALLRISPAKCPSCGGMGQPRRFHDVLRGVRARGAESGPLERGW